MSENVTSPNSHSVEEHPLQGQRMRPTARRSKLSVVILFLMVFGAQFAFGMWINSRGFILADAYSRAANALIILYSTDPHLGAVGFIWMPLPVLVELLWVAFYPIWPQVVSSGFASTFTTALAGGAVAALLLSTSRRLGFSEKLGWIFSLLVATNPMLFIYGSNGMSEGVAAPFLIGSVCYLVLFWHSGLRRYVTGAGLALALAFASLYQAAFYGAALFAALVLGVLWGSRENKESAPQGRWRAIEGLGILFLVPSFYVTALWVGANAVIMNDPFYFAHSVYSNQAYVQAAGVAGALAQATGNIFETSIFVAERALPFLIPGIFLLLARALDGRFWRVNTISLILLLIAVPLGFTAPFIYTGSSFGWLRYFMYPLFVAAGWGLYEVAMSRRSRLTISLILTSWIIAIPATFWAMSDPDLGLGEYNVSSLLSGKTAVQAGHADPLDTVAPVADYLDEKIWSRDQTVAADAVAGWTIAIQVRPENLRHFFLLTPDRKFRPAVKNPRAYNVSYLLVPNPDKVPLDAVVRTYPKLWAGERAGFELTKSFPNTFEEWRLYKVRDSP